MPSDESAFRDAVRRGYDSLAADYDATRDPEPAPLLTEALEAVGSGNRLLDAGCGGGRGVLEPFADRFDAVGMDASREQLRLAGETAPAACRAQGDLTRLPFADDAFDAVTALHSVIHVPKAQNPAVYREFRRVLRDGGVAVVTGGTAPFEGENEDWLDSGAAMQWSIPGPEDTTSMLREAGFEIVEAADYGSDAGGTWRFYWLE
jgi:SAM-dependent methyltransferase